MIRQIRAHGRAILAAGGGLLLVATIGAGAVVATSGGAPNAPAGAALLATDTTTAPNLGPAARLVLGGLARRTVSADLTVRTKDGFRTIRYERGQVTAVNSASVTVRTANGVSTTFEVTAQTKFRAKGQPITVSQLHVGDRAMVFATEQNGSFTAYLVRCIQPVGANAAPAAPAAPTVAPGNS